MTMSLPSPRAAANPTSGKGSTAGEDAEGAAAGVVVRAVPSIAASAVASAAVAGFTDDRTGPTHGDEYRGSEADSAETAYTAAPWVAKPSVAEIDFTCARGETLPALSVAST